MTLFTPIVYINNGEPLDQATLNRYVENIQENLEEIISRLTDVEGLSGGEVDEIPNTLALRDASGTTNFAQPTAAPHPIRLADTNENAAPDTVPMRDTNGTFAVSPPTADDHPVRRGDLNTSLPVGIISLWSGSVASIPAKWALCNGANGTPDLRSKFVVGAGGGYNPGNTGGYKDAAVISHSHSGSTNNAGNHQHTPLNDSETFLTKGVGYWVIDSGNNIWFVRETSHTGWAGNHSHSVSINSTGVSGTNRNLPPYYALAYIMYTG